MNARTNHPFAKRSAEMDSWRAEPISIPRILAGSFIGFCAVFLLAVVML